MQKRISLLLICLAVLLSLTATPGAFARPMPPLEDDPPFDDGGGGGGTYTPPPPFNPPPPPYYTAPNLYTYFQYNHAGWQSCNQVAHVWVGGGSDVPRGTTLYGAGVAVPDSRVVFGFYDAAGTLVKTHLSQEVRSNCVLHHEPEAISTSDLAPGYYYIYATFWGLSPYLTPIYFDLSGYAIDRQGAYISPLRIR